MNEVDRARIGKMLAGRMSVDEFEDILRREIEAALATLREKVRRGSEREEKKNVRTF